ncbi:MAG: D-alanyl-D-alanine carboxypeptidase [Clostridiales bacterium]|nr:D-alanyl-D-alanine carboxypeptidase [Clostridiales bacterium]
MKKMRIPVFFCAAALLAVLCAAPFSAAALYELPEDKTIYSSSAILVGLGATAAEDTVLFERKADQLLSPAAMVRVMVGALALKTIEENRMDIDTMTGTYTLQCDNLVTGTGLRVANMKIGDTWTVRDLLNMSMLQTAADACVTLAVTLGGSETQFVADMNALAKEIGCENTSFANVTGLDNANQYTTARDMARMLRYAMGFPEYEGIMKQTEYTAHPVGGQPLTLPNNNNLIRSSSPQSYYSRAVFGKTGLTDGAGYCLAAVARDGGYEYLAVVMKAPEKDDAGNLQGLLHYKDVQTLFSWAFDSFAYKTLLSKNEPTGRLAVHLAWSRDSVILVPERDFAAVVDKNLPVDTIIRKVVLRQEAVDAPVTKGEVYGRVELYINVDQKLGEVNLVASESLDRSEVLAAWEEIRLFLQSPWFLAGLGLLAVLLVGYLILNVTHNRKRRRKRMKRVRKYK